MKKMACRVALLLFILVGTCCASSVSHAQQDVPVMSKEALKPLLGSPDVTIIDLRFGRDWYDSDIKIKGAVREDPMKPGQWIDKHPKDKTLVFYCA